MIKNCGKNILCVDVFCHDKNPGKYAVLDVFFIMIKNFGKAQKHLQCLVFITIRNNGKNNLCA